jgi:hypothetical protein
MAKKRVITVSAMIGAFSLLVICFAAAQTTVEKKGPVNPVDDAYQRIYEASKQQRDSYQKHLDEDADRGKRVDALLVKYEEMAAREDGTAKRYAKILDTWEKQQLQHQKYLDSLSKK